MSPPFASPATERPEVAVVGIGEDGRAGLSARATTLVDGARSVVGGARHLKLAAPFAGRALRWRSPLAETAEDVRSAARPLVVLASGDPSWFGVAQLVRAWVGESGIEVVPVAGCVSLAAARLGWPIEELDVVSLHGRPVAGLTRWLQPGRRLLLLLGRQDDAGGVAALLARHGLWGAPAWVLTALGGPRETITLGDSTDLVARCDDDLAVVALDLRGQGGIATAASLVPGLPDERYEHDGQITKRDVRAATLARLAPLPGELLWDIGAGAGSIAIEWLRAEPSARAIAVEADATRAGMIRHNAGVLGVPQLEVVQGAAPTALTALPAPDAVFVGGAVADAGVLDAAWTALRPGGRLVANAVTLPGEMALIERRIRLGGDLVRIAVQHARPLGETLAWRPAIPVTQLCQVKP